MRGLFILNLFVYFFHCPGDLSARSHDSPETLSINGVSLYHNLGGPGKPAQKELKHLGIHQATVITGHFLHSEDGLTFTPDKLGPALRRLVPKGRSEHLIVLDWEGSRMQQIFEGAVSNSDEYREAKAQLLSAYRFTKKRFPDYIIGFYGFPIRDYWGRDEKWRKRNTALADFLAETDALFPSLYDFYETTPSNRMQEEAYIRENVEEALRLGKLLDKPVYPFIWHRYHPSNKQKGLEPIPPEEFKHHLRTILESNYRGNTATGLIWWSAEQYFFSTGETEDYDALYFDEKNGELIRLYHETLLEVMSANFIQPIPHNTPRIRRIERIK